MVYELMKEGEDTEDDLGLLFITFNLHHTAIIAANSETVIITRGSFSEVW